ncbi:hypothetical protein [uncultured Dermacoccus sp.]|uniref:hypothetical protein n=1 Tax=uncultured Dermacoccus sp. TaxID=339343 RepID=UPI002597F74A|nr:hypothetical protein [uncultured Dermacoccus sp.]
MNTILDVWCALCDRLAPFAVMAVVPLLLWVHHFETMPPADDATASDVTDLSSDSGKVVATTDTLEVAA